MSLGFLCPYTIKCSPKPRVSWRQSFTGQTATLAIEINLFWFYKVSSQVFKGNSSVLPDWSQRTAFDTCWCSLAVKFVCLFFFKLKSVEIHEESTHLLLMKMKSIRVLKSYLNLIYLRIKSSSSQTQTSLLNFTYFLNDSSIQANTSQSNFYLKIITFLKHIALAHSEPDPAFLYRAVLLTSSHRVRTIS